MSVRGIRRSITTGASGTHSGGHFWGVELGACGPRVYGTCFVCRWKPGFLPICEFYFSGIESLLRLVRVRSPSSTSLPREEFAVYEAWARPLVACLSVQESIARPSMRFLSSREASGESELSLSRFATPRPDRTLVSQFLLPAR
jgi:hypothetical protein